MSRLLGLLIALAPLTACGGSTQSTRMELRSSEQVQIAELLGCSDYDIEEVDGVEGSESRLYHAGCAAEGSSTETIRCSDGGSCVLQ